MKNFPRTLRHDSGAMMELDLLRLLLSFRKPTNQKTVATTIASLELILEQDTGEKARGSQEVVNHTSLRFWVRTADGTAIGDERYDAIVKRLGAGLEWAGPVYRLPNVPGRGGLVCPLPDVVMFRLAAAEETGRRRLTALAREFTLSEVKEKSAHLSGLSYYKLGNMKGDFSYQIVAQLREQKQGIEVFFENMPMLIPLTLVANDPLFAQQWGLTQIQAAGPGVTGWDIGTGAGITIAILDTGVDLTHPDLNLAGQGIRLDTMMPNGAPASGGSNIGHGTCCAGMAAGRFNNTLGVSGSAGSASILPIAFVNWTDAECAAGINWAAANGAQVLSMSFGQYAAGDPFGPQGWNFAVIDPAVANAVDVAGLVLLAATGNENTGIVNRYPARNGRVIAVGGSDQADNRKNPASPDGENWWGANFGPGISVAAPCVRNPTTDIQGTGGYNTAAGTAGDYDLTFNGTSSATPFCAGLAAVIRGAYPALTNLEVRELIERTADKVGGIYADAPGFPNGTRTNELGYGRINMFRALDEADIFIRDYPADTGIEPSSPPGGDFWDFSDVVVRITDDNVFNPGNPAQSKNVERGQTNYIYVQVTNRGPREARNIVVNARITPYVGVDFVHPADWTAVDATHVSPTPVSNTFATLAAGTSVMAKFSVSAADVESLWGWENSHPWHPCLLVSVNADNDYAFATATTGANPVVRRNNIAQRNLSVIDVLATASVAFPFVAGNALDRESAMQLVVKRESVPANVRLLLALDDDGAAFPRLRFDRQPAEDTFGCSKEGQMVFVDRTRIETNFGCCKGVLTLEAGSRFDCAPPRGPGKVAVRGGEVILRGEKRYVDIRDQTVIIEMEKVPGRIYPFSVETQVPADAKRGEMYQISVAQRSLKGETLGGASVIYRIG